MKRLGVDVGSTTLKCVVLSETGEILYSAYMRHFSRIAESLGELLGDIQGKYPGRPWR